MGKTFKKPQALSDQHTHYCPGCTHGVIHRLVAEVIDELGIQGKTVGGGVGIIAATDYCCNERGEACVFYLW